MSTANDRAAHGKRLHGKRALITGAAGGIAQAIAKDFVREGAELLLTDLSNGPMEPFAEALHGSGIQPVLIPADVTRRRDVENLAERGQSLGGIDILVTCAGGYSSYADFEAIEEDDWDRVIDINLKSVFLCCRAVLPMMKDAGWGRIINLGSLAGRSTSAGSSPAHYATAKAGVSILTQYIAKDVAPFGITANTVAPGTTKTDRVKNMLTPEKESQFLERTPMGRLAEPEDIAGVVTFLASDESRYITGATIDVNGGRLMLT
jgi:NAD(P)-dependent dehydrogenase (short-subunit alcohol dehydrogenase family)